MTTVPISEAMFRPDHIVLLAKHPAVPLGVVDTNDSTVTCDYDRRVSGDDDVNVADRLTPVELVDSVHN